MRLGIEQVRVGGPGVCFFFFDVQVGIRCFVWHAHACLCARYFWTGAEANNADTFFVPMNRRHTDNN